MEFPILHSPHANTTFSTLIFSRNIFQLQGLVLMVNTSESVRTSWVVSAELHPPACPAAAAGLTHSCLFASNQNQTVQLSLFITGLFKCEAL